MNGNNRAARAIAAILASAVIVSSWSRTLRADCPPSPTTDTETGRIEGLAHETTENAALNAAVTIDRAGQFAITYVTHVVQIGGVEDNDLLAIRFDVDGTCINANGDCCPVSPADPAVLATFYEPTIAVRPGVEQLGSQLAVGFIVHRSVAFGTNNPHVSHLSFPFYTNPDPYCYPYVPRISPSPNPDGADVFPSVGIGRVDGDPPSDAVSITWGRDTGEPHGLLYALPITPFDPIRTCTTSEEYCYLTGNEAKWQPCIASADDARFVIAFADSEDIGEPFPPFNIRLRQYGADGTPVGEEVLVNDPASEVGNTSQYSAAVAFDGDSIIVAYAGFRLPGCGGPLVRIFARRFAWNGTNNDGPIPVSRPFVVDSDPDWAAPDFEQANPTVALTNSTDPCERGSFCVAWNSKRVNGTGGQIGDRAVHMQFFGRNGRARGREFQAHVQDFDTDETAEGGDLPYLAESAQHTLGYSEETTVLTWTVTGSDPASDPPRVLFTLIPEDYVATLDAADPCIKGDVDGNGLVDGRDIQPFVTLLISGEFACMAYVDLCAADANSDGVVDTQDIPCTVARLIDNPCDASDPCTTTYRGWADCNANSVPDANDIASATSQDCNNNGVPDECDVNAEDPDGNELVSDDDNENGVPDECEPDCNVNGIPDDKDIADETSADLNANGIPDECEPDCNANGIPDDMDVDPLDPDGNEQVSADCNANGVPDECEPDCNSNGVPDDCDIDPLDPDGDEWVSPDCNENGMPDECDMAMGPPFGSYDCNENGIPDECDIANETSADCNGNGIPDECDIAAEISEDTNENGIPDECEQEGRSGGGDSPSPPPSPLEGEGVEAAWVEYYDWVAEQQWGPNAETPMFEQFKRSVDKLRALGLLPG